MSGERRFMREGAPQVPRSLLIEGTNFELVDIQRDNESAVYRGPDSYLRIGSPARINADIKAHKLMESVGFPVAKLVSEGMNEEEAYFIESSVGDKHLGKLFAEDIEANGRIEEETFKQLLEVTGKFARAQLRTQIESEDYGNFTNNIHLEELCEEMPNFSTRIRDRFEVVKEKIAEFPFVLSHGDFNPNNLYPKGAIDFEHAFYGPFGHDLIGSLVHIDYFPDSRDYEYFAKYRFTDSQKTKYLEMLDTICDEASLPHLSDVKDEFEFTRAVWLLVRLHRHPKLQRFRYDRFIAKFLN